MRKYILGMVAMRGRERENLKKLKRLPPVDIALNVRVKR